MCLIFAVVRCDACTHAPTKGLKMATFFIIVWSEDGWMFMVFLAYTACSLHLATTVQVVIHTMQCELLALFSAHRQYNNQPSGLFSIVFKQAAPSPSLALFLFPYLSPLLLPLFFAFLDIL